MRATLPNGLDCCQLLCLSTAGHAQLVFPTPVAVKAADPHEDLQYVHTSHSIFPWCANKLFGWAFRQARECPVALLGAQAAGLLPEAVQEAAKQLDLHAQRDLRVTPLLLALRR